MCYIFDMKGIHPLKKSLGKKTHTSTEKADVVRRATMLTLKRFSKTFEDLARYDRTEKARS